jgi:hypothetical protein
MRKWYLMVISALLMVSQSIAQKFEGGIDIGYGIGIGGALKGRYSIGDSNDYTDIKQVYGSGGNGAKVMVHGAYFFNENVGIIAITGYSTFGGYTTGEETPFDTIKNTTNASYIPVNIGVKFRTKLWGFQPYMYLAPGIYFPMVSETDSVFGLSNRKITYSYAPGFGFSAAMGVAYWVMQNVGIKFEFAPTYAFANRTQETVEFADGTKHTTIFKNNTVTLPESTGDTDYRRDQIKDSFSSWAIKAGLVFGF